MYVFNFILSYFIFTGTNKFNKEPGRNMNIDTEAISVELDHK